MVARLARGSTLSLKERTYIEGARGLGAGGGRIMGRHILPGMIAPIRDLDPNVRAIDGGIVDYHFDGSQCAGRFTLYPHFRDTLTPGWFDKPWRSRHLPAADVDDLLVICPSPAFVAQLPGGRIPDRDDPRRYPAEQCAKNWHLAGLMSRRLGEALEEVLEQDRIPELLARTA